MLNRPLTAGQNLFRTTSSQLLLSIVAMLPQMLHRLGLPVKEPGPPFQNSVGQPQPHRAPKRTVKRQVLALLHRQSFHFDTEDTGHPAIRRLTACVIAGYVGHASVHCDSGPRAWGPGERARCVFHSSSTRLTP